MSIQPQRRVAFLIHTGFLGCVLLLTSIWFEMHTLFNGIVTTSQHEILILLYNHVKLPGAGPVSSLAFSPSATSSGLSTPPGVFTSPAQLD